MTVLLLSLCSMVRRQAARHDRACRRARDRQGRCAPLTRWPEDGPSLTAAALDGTDRPQVGTEGWCRSNKRIGQDDVVPQDFPLPLPARPIVFGKRKRHYFCDHHLSLVADRDKSGFVLFCTAHHIARTKCILTVLDSLFSAVSSNFVGSLDDGNKSRIISYRDQKKGQIPSRIMLRLNRL